MGNTILIADDNPADLELLSMQFRDAGFTVYTAGSAVAAIMLAGLHLPDCFILDYHLGTDTAAGVCAFIRGDARLGPHPIIILSGDPEQVIRSYEVCQADVFVEKDSSFEKILAITRRHLRRAGLSREVCGKIDLALDAVNQRIIRGSYPAIELTPEQFRFFSLIFGRSPRFVTEKEICQHVIRQAVGEGGSAIRSLVRRLRSRLGPQLARRIKSRRRSGWIYVPPRLHPRPRPRLQAI